MRRILTTVHRALALVAGLFLAVLGLSGSATVFTETLMRWETGDRLFPPPAAGPPASFETLMDNTLARYPNLKPSAIISPGAAVIQTNAALVVGQQSEPGSRPVYYIVGLDAHTGEVLGHIIFERSLSMLPYFIHGRLLLPDEEVAHTVLGVLALVIITMLFTGTYLTWPRGARWRNVFVPRRGLPAPAR